MRKVLLINNLAGYGRESINLQMPIIDACGDAAFVLPTSYTTSNRKFDNIYKIDLSNHIKNILSTYEKNNFKFNDCICGCIGNEDSILDVKEFLANQKLENDNMIIMIDPTLGDDGKKYDYVNDKYIDNMKNLITIADVITPNLTEACLLTGVDYESLRLKLGILEYDGKVDEKDENAKKIVAENLRKVSDIIVKDLKPVLDKIIYKRLQVTVITGIEIYNCMVTLLDIYNGDQKKRQTTCNFAIKYDKRNGTGDMFDAMFLEMSNKGYNLIESLKISTSFIQESLKFSSQFKIPIDEGPCMEPILVPNLEFIRTHTKMNNKNEKENK